MLADLGLRLLIKPARCNFLSGTVRCGVTRHVTSWSDHPTPHLFSRFSRIRTSVRLRALLIGFPCYHNSLMIQFSEISVAVIPNFPCSYIMGKSALLYFSTEHFYEAASLEYQNLKYAVLPCTTPTYQLRRLRTPSPRYRKGT